MTDATLTAFRDLHAAMTVAELITALEAQDADLEVKFAYNYGDHGRTTVAANVRRIEEADVVYSEYHKSDRIADDEDIRTEDPKTVVVLSARGIY